MIIVGHCPDCQDTGSVRDVDYDPSRGRVVSVSGYCPTCEKGLDLRTLQAAARLWKSREAMRISFREPPAPDQVIAVQQWISELLSAIECGDPKAIELAIEMHGQRRPVQACAAAGIELK